MTTQQFEEGSFSLWFTTSLLVCNAKDLQLESVEHIFVFIHLSLTFSISFSHEERQQTTSVINSCVFSAGEIMGIFPSHFRFCGYLRISFMVILKTETPRCWQSFDVSLVKALVFPVVMYGCELDHKEGWVPKNWHFQSVVLEKTLESPFNCKDIKPVSLKGNQSWIFIGWTDAEAPIFWPPDAKSQLTGKDPDAGKDWGQEEKEATEDEMVGWHHWLSGHEFEQTQEDSEGQRSLVCCSPWGHKESDTT